MTDARQPEGPKPAKIPRVEIYWTTVTYKTVTVYLLLAFVIIMTSLYVLFPQEVSSLIRRASNAVGGGGAVASPALTQVRFVNLDGKVQVKKVNSVQWLTASYGITLDKGDLIQTSADGVARLAFPDGTTYTVKNDTLIMVEENSVGPDRPTRVGVSITSGALDLSTASWESPGSKAEIKFPQDKSVASIDKNSRATVRSDPESKQQEITVTAGNGELKRGEESVQLGRYERATFKSGGPVTKSQVLAPPELQQPGNLNPIIVDDPKQTPVHFEWKPVPGATHYLLRVSTNSMFSHVLIERKVSGTSTEVTGLVAGDYFWLVSASDAQNRTSEPSDTFKFMLAEPGHGQEMLLEVDGTQLHGSVVEVIGRTEPGATLLVNGQPVAQIERDGRFQYFTPPMTRGSQTIVIIGQNRRGGTAIKRVPIVVP